MNLQFDRSHLKRRWIDTRVGDVDVTVTGIVFEGDRILAAEEIAERIETLFHSDDESAGWFGNLHGEFALVARGPERAIAFVDRMRSIPLFFAQHGDTCLLSDSVEFLRNVIGAPIDQENALEYLMAGFVSGDRTLCRGVYQLQAGEALIVDGCAGSVRQFVWAPFGYHDFYPITEEERILDDFDEAYEGLFERLIASTVARGHTLVLPLSGGLDSRLTAAWLDRLGVEDVICYSYGPPGSMEVAISRKVAATLGYPWLQVEYDRDALERSYRSQRMTEYMCYASNLTSLPHIQDFHALEVLTSRNAFPDGSIVIPAHTVYPCTTRYRPSLQDLHLASDACTPSLFAIDTAEEHYSLWIVSSTHWNRSFQQHLETRLAEFSVSSGDSLGNFVNAIETYSHRERHAKFILNSVRAYEFFGLGWRLPLWDLGLINVVLKIPVELRLDKKCYRRYAAERLFVGDRHRLGEIRCTTGIHDSGRALPPWLHRGIACVYGRIKPPVVWYSGLLPSIGSSWGRTGRARGDAVIEKLAGPGIILHPTGINSYVSLDMLAPILSGALSSPESSHHEEIPLSPQ
jgi:asparagine synthase (glutamine-hydrolysing)